MSRGAVAVALFVLFVGAAAGARPSLPSDRGCLIAWNAPSNHANRAKLIAVRPVSGVSLHPGASFTDIVTVTTKKAVTKSSTEACLLAVAKAGTIQIVTGRWSSGRVGRWSWGRAIPTTNAFPANVRLLSDGRVTKIYSR